MPTTHLNYDIVPSKSPLYTTVDQLNQSTAALPITATNASTTPVTIKVIEIELKRVDQGVDSVQLLLPGSESGIECPTSLTGPGGSNWSITKDDGKLTLKPTPDASTVTFQPRDTLSLTLQNVVIREGGTGTAFVPVLESSGAGKGETAVGIGITQSTLNVQLSSDAHMVEPGGSATLTWTTNNATSGTLVLPGNSPDSITIPSTSLASGQQQVWPIEDTTYSLTCEGLGPNVTAEVPVNVDSLQMGDLESSAETVHLGGQVLLSWQTNADTCALDDGSGVNPVPAVPTTVPNTGYPIGYPVNPEKQTKYTLHGTKRLSNGNYVDDSRNKTVYVYPVSIGSFSSSAAAFSVNDTITLSWKTYDAISCSLSTNEGSGSVTLPVSNGQTASCHVGATPDGQTLIVTRADGSNQELGRLNLPAPCPPSATFILSVSGPNSNDSKHCRVNLLPVQINQFNKGVGSQGRWVRSTEFSHYEVFYWLELTWNVTNAGTVEVVINGSPYSNDPSGSWNGTWGPYNPPGDTATISCTGFGGPLNQ